MLPDDRFDDLQPKVVTSKIFNIITSVLISGKRLCQQGAYHLAINRQRQEPNGLAQRQLRHCETPSYYRATSGKTRLRASNRAGVRRRSLLKVLVGHIGADIRACGLRFLRCACPTSLLGFFYVFEPRSLLCICWFFILRNIGPVFRLKYVSLNMFGL